MTGRPPRRRLYRQLVDDEREYQRRLFQLDVATLRRRETAARTRAPLRDQAQLGEGGRYCPATGREPCLRVIYIPFLRRVPCHPGFRRMWFLLLSAGAHQPPPLWTSRTIVVTVLAAVIQTPLGGGGSFSGAPVRTDLRRGEAAGRAELDRGLDAALAGTAKNPAPNAPPSGRPHPPSYECRLCGVGFRLVDDVSGRPDG